MLTQTADLSGTRSKLLLLAYLAFVALPLSGGLLGVAWPTMRLEFSQPLEAMGLMFVTSTVGYLLSSFFIARLINRFGIGALLLFSCLLSVVTLVGYTLAPSWVVLAAIGALGGFAGGVLDAGLNVYLAAEYNEGQMQWLHACFGIGSTISPLIMTFSLARFGAWRPGYLIVAVVMLLMAVIFWTTLSAWKRPNHPASAAAQPESPERGLMDYQTSLWKTLLVPVVWGGILMFLIYTGAELTLGNWTYTLFTEGRGVSPQLAGLWAGGFWATFTLGRLLAGLYAHRLSLNALMLGEMALSLVGALLFWWNPLPWVGVAGVFLVGFAMAPIFPGLVSSTSGRVGAHHAGNAIGIQMSAAALGGAFLPSLAGALAERVSLEAIPAMLVVSLLVLLLLYLVSMRLARLAG